MLGLGNSLVSGTVSEQLYSITFDGTGDYVDIDDVLDLGTADFSIALWFKCSDTTDQRLFSKFEDANNQILIKTNGADKVNWQVLAGGETVCNFTGANALTAGDNLQGTWIHVCVTADRDGNGTIYVNGVTTTYGKAAADLNRDSDNLDNSGNWFIGRHGSTYMTGNVDEVAIWGAALSSSAVNAVYNAGTPFDLTSDRGDYDSSSALKGYWRMDDGSGAAVADSVGSNNGSLAADATFSTDTPPN